MNYISKDAYELTVKEYLELIAILLSHDGAEKTGEKRYDTAQYIR